MRKIKLIKVTKPKILSYGYHGKERGIEFVCSECNCIIAEEYKCCPYCGAEIDWGKIIW